MTIEDVDSSIIYGLDYQARTLCNVPGDADNVQFLVGTQTLKFDNQVCLLSLDEDTNQVHKQSFLHPGGEIWHISSFPSDKRIFSTCYSTVQAGRCVNGCNIWSLGDSEQPNQNLELMCTVDTESASSVSCFYWQPIVNNCKKAFILFDRNLAVVDTGSVGKQCFVESKTTLDPKIQHKFMAGKWNPHHNCNTIATAVDSIIKGWDIRCMKQTFSIDTAHVPMVRDLDFNPNRQYILASVGDDCRVKFWDVRNTEKPLNVVARHSHWVWCVRYNPIHDQLLLSCSSDARVLLHCVASLSSEPIEIQDEEVDEDAQSLEIKLEDGILKTFEEHEESVYCCEWSSSDPWVFASLSYDGRVILSRVPRDTKYKIMQL